MKERPILFSGPMVRAILDGRKTQTRRAIKPQPIGGVQWSQIVIDGHGGWADGHGRALRCPYGQPGDRLWIRETHHIPGGYLNTCEIKEISKGISSPESLGITYRADAPSLKPCDGGWRPSIHMPRWASRILLEVVDVRVERLQEISEADARAEGGPRHGHSGTPISGKAGFRHVWGSINGVDSWDANHWVWVVEFKRLEAGGSA